MTEEFEYWACVPDQDYGYAVERRTVATKKALEKEIKGGYIDAPGMPSTSYEAAAQQVIEALEFRQRRLKTETRDLLPDLRYVLSRWFFKLRWNVKSRRRVARQLKQAREIWG